MLRLFIALVLAIGLSFDLYAQSNEVVSNPYDKSIVHMRIIFGDVVNVITGGEQPDIPDSILGQMSRAFNAGMIVLTTILILFLVVTGTIKSAEDHETIGKRFSATFVPLRMVMALSFVIPMSSGYSVMQIGVLWVAGNGVQLANNVFNEANEFMRSGNTRVTIAAEPNFESFGLKMLPTLVCAKAVNSGDGRENIRRNGKSDGYTYLYDSEHVELPGITDTLSNKWDSFINAVGWGSGEKIDFTQGIIRKYDGTGCGGFKLSTAYKNEEVDEIREAKLRFTDSYIENLTLFLDDLDALAGKITYNALLNENSSYDSDLLNAVEDAKSRYRNASVKMGEEVTAYRDLQWGDGMPIAGSTLNANDCGWVCAGAFYWEYARNQNDASTFARNTNANYISLNENMASHASLEKPFLLLDRYIRTERNLIDNNGNVIKAQTFSTFSQNAQLPGQFSSNVDFGLVKLITNFTIREGETPIEAVASLGNMLLAVSDILVATRAATEAAKDELLNNWGANLLASLPGIGALARTSTVSILKVLIDVLSVFLIAAVALGIMMGIYLPLVPLIHWIMGVLGYYVMLVEAIVLAPVHAILHAMPEGDGLAGKRAEIGYMIVVTLFLRPTFMLFGFFAAILLMIVSGHIAVNFFSSFLVSYHAPADILDWGLFWVTAIFGTIYVMAVVLIQICHRVFGLINEVPDKALRMLGGGMESLGEQSAVQGAQSTFAVVAGNIQGGTSAPSQKN